MEQVRVDWSGGGMGAGLTLLYFKDGTAATHLPAVHDLLAAYAGSAPSQVSVRVQGSGLTMDLEGHITGTWSGTAPAQITGGATGATFAAGVGMRIRWFTSVVVNGHKVRGSTFLVPLATGAYQDDGSIQPGVVSANQTAVNAFVTATAGDFGIWTRPKTPTGGGGLSGVTSGLIPDRVSWLRTRRT